MSERPAPEDLKPTAPPKVFISYSWTSAGHQEMVRQWAERLLSDGVEVVIDIFDLREGHDKYHFMERMVTDPQITHVLVISDKVYAAKADAKKAGVGTESQIISSEVYGRVEQSKFIPIVCEFSEQGEPCLPVFLRSRIWINFSSLEAVNQNWEQLIRLLHGKPAYQKPMVGRPPAYITASTGALASPIIGKLATLKQAFLSNTKSLTPYRQDFLSTCVDYADSLRVRKAPELDVKGLAQKILQDCGRLKDIRNQIVDWLLLESGPATTQDFQEALLRFLEDLRELKARPAELSGWNDAWFEAHSVFVYETFLYSIAALLKTASYALLHEIFTSHYLKPRSDRYGEDQFDDFGTFYGYSEMLQPALAPEGPKFLSPAAELIKRQADRTDLPFSAIIEAELLVLLMALIAPDTYWFPQTLYYQSQSDFPFFVRATQHRNFQKLATITGISNANDLREAAKAGCERLQVKSWSGFRRTRTLWESMNMERLDSLK